MNGLQLISKECNKIIVTLGWYSCCSKPNLAAKIFQCEVMKQHVTIHLSNALFIMCLLLC